MESMSGGEKCAVPLTVDTCVFIYNNVDGIYSALLNINDLCLCVQVPVMTFHFNIVLVSPWLSCVLLRIVCVVKATHSGQWHQQPDEEVLYGSLLGSPPLVSGNITLNVMIRSFLSFPVKLPIWHTFAVLITGSLFSLSLSQHNHQSWINWPTPHTSLGELPREDSQCRAVGPGTLNLHVGTSRTPCCPISYFSFSSFCSVSVSARPGGQERFASMWRMPAWFIQRAARTEPHA